MPECNIEGIQYPINMNMFKPRYSQEQVLNFRQGRMGVSAVPGSGKTQTLSCLAALLINEGFIREDQEVLIVTLVNSAVDNFTSRVESFIKAYGFIPGINYRVRTLHGLAHDIIRERPDLVGLSEEFLIIDNQETDEIIDTLAHRWLISHPEMVNEYFHPDYDPRNNNLLRKWHALIKEISSNFIRQAKDYQASPEELRKMIDNISSSNILLNMGCDIYQDYQRALNYRNAVDFDDLIHMALKSLKLDPDFLARLRYRWPYILEDEAQDSSRLQEQILDLLVGEDGNWVRVGDPNQAIYETFTTANPEYLRQFIKKPGVLERELPNSGRSTKSIIDLANHFIRWTMAEHPNEALRDALSEPMIEPSPPDDPQPNPPDDPKGIHIHLKKLSPEKELATVIRSLKKWLPEHQSETVAILVPRNERGTKVVELLKNENIEYIELLKSSISTRNAAAKLVSALKYLADPTSPAKLSTLFNEVNKEKQTKPEIGDVIKETSKWIRTCSRLENYIWPSISDDWVKSFNKIDLSPIVLQQLDHFQRRIRKWQLATLLPIDQLVLTVSQDIFDNPADLALAYKISLVLERAQRIHPEWHLPEMALELESVAKNQRKFIGFTDEDTGFNPDNHKGKVVVSTIHKAKGLEWDRVYLISVNNYDFPSGELYDTFIAEKWFVRDHLNLEAEMLTGLDSLMAGNVTGLFLEEGHASLEARKNYARERLRLLFVGITRARKELIITWNTGKSVKNPALPAIPLNALHFYLEKQANARAE